MGVSMRVVPDNQTPSCSSESEFSDEDSDTTETLSGDDGSALDSDSDAESGEQLLRSEGRHESGGSMDEQRQEHIRSTPRPELPPPAMAAVGSGFAFIPGRQANQCTPGHQRWDWEIDASYFDPNAWTRD